jgi:hypothetical protein
MEHFVKLDKQQNIPCQDGQQDFNKIKRPIKLEKQNGILPTNLLGR